MGCSSSATENTIIPKPNWRVEEGFAGTTWLPFELKLPVHIRYNFIVTKGNHEFIGVFSEQCGDWGSGSDGLSWHVATNRCDFQFRTKIFGAFPEN